MTPPDLAVYKFRFFYDWGSGICLWSANDEARELYGYPVNLNDLPISQALVTEGNRLAELWDTSLDWNDPAGDSPWNDEQYTQFYSEARQFIQRLEQALGLQYKIIDEL